MLMFGLKMIRMAESLNSILYIVSDLVLKECDPFATPCPYSVSCGDSREQGPKSWALGSQAFFLPV